MEWQRHLQEQEQEAEAVQKERERQRKEEEEQEVRRLRVEAVHKAKPIRNYKPVEVKKSDKPLTQPETPHFSERLRSRTNKCWDTNNAS